MVLWFQQQKTITEPQTAGLPAQQSKASAVTSSN